MVAEIFSTFCEMFNVFKGGREGEGEIIINSVLTAGHNYSSDSYPRPSDAPCQLIN